VHKCKIEETKEHNFIPEPVALNSKIYCAAFLYDKYSGEKENSANNVKVNKWQPGIEE